jgi:hypothetical protein
MTNFPTSGSACPPMVHCGCAQSQGQLSFCALGAMPVTHSRTQCQQHFPLSHHWSFLQFPVFSVGPSVAFDTAAHSLLLEVAAFMALKSPCLGVPPGCWPPLSSLCLLNIADPRAHILTLYPLIPTLPRGWDKSLLTNLSLHPHPTTIIVHWAIAVTT